MRTIALIGKHGSGKYAIVDDIDYERLSMFRWFYVPQTIGVGGYVQRSCGIGNQIRMHWDVFGDKMIDHINGDTLDNRISNLRKCTTSQNGMNRQKHKEASSKYKGVVKYISKYTGKVKWRAGIRAEGPKMMLGTFDSEVGAAQAYNIAAKKYFGEFAKLNEV